ncbi:HAD family hydrolase [Streptosporangium sp. DT93]|uniref:HAD family hydrolase n=1 Tax=Streptosporangium sp. DT93 TaxID=3393428 RepID=UPI003CEF797D
MLKGVLIDWGGVLTVGLSEAVAEWIAEERLDADHYGQVMIELISHAYEGSQSEENAIHALERGEMSGLDFERHLAARLVTTDGLPPEAEGLLSRMFARFHRVEPMYEMLREIRASGLRTCLLSNSWANEYPREGWDDVFDEVVISGEVGMRKPEPRIFEHALGRIGLAGEECVFVDDVLANIEAARGFGIVGVHHRDPDLTIAELERLLRISLR